MSKKDRRKMEKKRRKEREQSRQKSVPMAYHGNKYKTPKFVDLTFRTEAGIYEAFVMDDRKLTDHDVHHELEKLIRGIRDGSIQFSAWTKEVGSDSNENLPGLLIWNIRRNWQIYLEKHSTPARDDIVGVLRTILGSIEVWGSINPESRGYLRYLEGFMKELGVHCRKVSPDTEIVPLDETDEIDEDELESAGRAWIHNFEPDAATFFRALAYEMIDSGEAEYVLDTCQYLMDETSDREITAELEDISIKAQKRITPEPGRLTRALGWLLSK